MHKKATVPTPYGPVEVDVVSCDGPECSAVYLKEHLVGWHRLVPQGVEVAAFGKLPDPLDYCSLNCLKNSLNLMTGS